MASGKSKRLPANLMDFGIQVTINSNESKTIVIGSSWSMSVAIIATGTGPTTKAIFDVIMGYATASRCAIFSMFTHDRLSYDLSDTIGKTITITSTAEGPLTLNIIPLAQEIRGINIQ